MNDTLSLARSNSIRELQDKNFLPCRAPKERSSLDSHRILLSDINAANIQIDPKPSARLEDSSDQYLL